MPRRISARCAAALTALLIGCGGDPEPDLGEWSAEIEGDALTLRGPDGGHWRNLRFQIGTGSADIEFQFGSFRFDDVRHTLTPAAQLHWDDGALVLSDAIGGPLARLIVEVDDRHLSLKVDPAASPGANGRFELSGACDADDHFLGTGSHAMDVDHVGQAFPLFVSEPGIGKVDTEEYPGDWFVTGTRHASSYPVPFLLRPHHPDGLLLDTLARVELDLCAADPNRYTALTWSARPTLRFIDGTSPLQVVERLTERTGRPDLAPAWAFGPWTDSIRGVDRLFEVANTLRDAGAPSTVMWTEDWKGARELSTGYRLSKEWFIDDELYPDASSLSSTLAELGFKWFGYFGPFVGMDDVSGAEAIEADVLIKREDGSIYTFTGVTFEPVSLLDFTHPDATNWAVTRMRDHLNLGFSGWMADYAEWLPHDALLFDGRTGLAAHNGYPRMWQDAARRAIEGYDATYFCRSGWANTSGTCPIVWAGDQRTSFQPDDGFPTIVPLGLGMSASGVPVYTHDIAGYQSVGNPPSTRELWLRWAALGAWSPIMRTHHGAFDQDNWQFDTDADTVERYARLATEHMRTWPYRYGLARQAHERGTPMVLPPSFLYDDDWGRMDAWLLGRWIFVAPVLEEGATGRDVQLPGHTAWYNFHTGQPATSGYVEVEPDGIPVYVARGATIPLFNTVPHTLVDTVDDPRVIPFEVADAERVVRVYGRGGRFTEGDGTQYQPSGEATEAATAQGTFTSGTLDAGGVTVKIEGPRERTYILEVLP